MSLTTNLNVLHQQALVLKLQLILRARFDVKTSITCNYDMVTARRLVCIRFRDIEGTPQLIVAIKDIDNIVSEVSDALVAECPEYLI